MNSRSASIAGDQEAGGSSSFAWCNRQWLSSQALTRRSSVRPKQAVFNHNLLWLPESNGYPLTPELWAIRAGFKESGLGFLPLVRTASKRELLKNSDFALNVCGAV